MGKMKKHFAILFIGLMVSTGASAVDITTLGDRSCSDWNKDRGKKGWEAISDSSWLSGYLTGLSVGMKKDILANRDAESIFPWIDTYCSTNPLETLSNAGDSLASEMMK